MQEVWTKSSIKRSIKAMEDHGFGPLEIREDMIDTILTLAKELKQLLKKVNTLEKKGLGKGGRKRLG